MPRLWIEYHQSEGEGMTKHDLWLNLLYAVEIPLFLCIALTVTTLNYYFLELQVKAGSSLIPVILVAILACLYTWYLIKATKAIVRRYKEGVKNNEAICAKGEG